MAKRILREDLITEVVKDTGLDRTQVRMVWDALFANVILAVSQGKRVVLTGFGTFYPKRRKARTARNINTGETIRIPARTVPQFVPGEWLKTAAYKQEGI